MTHPSLEIVAWISLALASIPTFLFLANLPFYRRLPRARTIRPARGRSTSVSVLIPARDEERAIPDALRAILRDPNPGLEVLVLDDHSTDRTAERVLEFAKNDPRVRLIGGRELPEGWCGKQHACWQLAQAARGEILVFLDADVRLEPEALPRIATELLARPSLHLASGVPRQVTVGLLEKLLIPLIHFVLLGYLPMLAARFSRWTAFAAGCGQLFVARRTSYFAAGGHQAIRASLHDGIQLPRAFRRHGFRTGLFDATDLARCRMYSTPSEVWHGLGKNATEGMAQSGAILPWTILLLGGHVLPWILLAFSPGLDVEPTASRLGALALLLGVLTRLAAAVRFRQPWLGALLHPVGVALLVALQWFAFAKRWSGRPAEWRGRQYPQAGSVQARSPCTPSTI